MALEMFGWNPPKQFDQTHGEKATHYGPSPTLLRLWLSASAAHYHHCPTYEGTRKSSSRISGHFAVADDRTQKLAITRGWGASLGEVITSVMIGNEARA